MSKTKYVDTNIAGYMLGISAGRIRKLLGNRRIEGAFKIAGVWQIPLYDGKPKVKRAPWRHRKGSWDKERGLAKDVMIHVYSQRIKSNKDKTYPEPPIIVRLDGIPEVYCHELEIDGRCRMVYNPHKPKHRAVLWIDVEPHIEIKTRVFKEPKPQNPPNLEGAGGSEKPQNPPNLEGAGGVKITSELETS